MNSSSKIVSEAERGLHTKKKFLTKLRDFQGYPFNEYEDGALFHYIYEEYPGIDFIAELDKKILWWKDHPGALGKGSKFHRVQLDEWFQKEYKFQKRGGPQQLGEIMKIDDPDHRNWLKQAIGTGDSQRKKES